MNTHIILEGLFPKLIPSFPLALKQRDRIMLAFQIVCFGLMMVVAVNEGVAQQRRYDPGSDESSNKRDKKEASSQESIPLDHFYAPRKQHGFRTFLSHFTLAVGTGVGNSFMSHNLQNVTLYQGVGATAPQLTIRKLPLYFTNWVNRMTISPNGTALPTATAFAVKSDTASIGFHGNALNVPIEATLHYEFKRYRIGVGYSYEYFSMGPMSPTHFVDRIQSFRPAPSVSSASKYFAVLGVTFYQWNDLLMVADLRVGGWSLGPGFEKEFLKPGVYVNAGLRFEYELSEYFKVFVRPSVEYKDYTLSFPNQAFSVTHTLPAVQLGLGVSYRVPELPRCFHPYCHAQIDHVHDNREYRSRVHPFFMKQNPHYGENYRAPKKNKEKREPRTPTDKRRSR